MKVYVTIGLPGSGKSTWAKNIAKSDDNIVIINRDGLRSMIRGEYVFDVRYERLIKEATDDMIMRSLESGFDVIIDETHIRKDRRQEIIDIVRDFDEYSSCKTEVVYVWFTENEKNVENRMKEPRGYDREKWTEVIAGMKKSFEYPEENEDYDAISLKLFGDFQPFSELKRRNGYYIG